MDGQTDAEKPVVPPPEDAKPAESAPTTATTEQHHRFFDVRGPKKDQAPTPDAKPPVDQPKPAAPAATNTEPAENLPDEMPDMAAAPAEEKTPATDDPAKMLEDSKKKDKQSKAPKPPKPPRQPGVGLAIFATIVIVLGLAALATYAYFRTNNIAIF